MKDLKGDDIISEIKRYANGQHEGQMAALVIMAHGDGKGRIMGTDKKPVSVKDIIEALCGSLHNIPKVSQCQKDYYCHEIAHFFATKFLPRKLLNNLFLLSTTKAV